MLGQWWMGAPPCALALAIGALGCAAEGAGTACIADRTGCFQDHGHWINMQGETTGRVACGFYKMANGRYWMNQDFGR